MKAFVSARPRTSKEAGGGGGRDQGQDIGDEGTLRRGDVGRSVVNAYFWFPELIFIR